MISPSVAASRVAAAARVAARIPKGTWDTHMHVLDPVAFPPPGTGQYKMTAHAVGEARSFLRTLGIEKMNIVQPSTYGNDNACTLDGLKKLGTKNGRAFVQFDPNSTPPSQLRKWHEMGVRGVRLNYKSVGAAVTAADLSSALHQYARAVRELDWTLCLYMSLPEVTLLEPIVPTLGDVKICIDHFGHPSPKAISAAKTAHDLRGFDSLVKLLEQGQTWVKLSATYRLDIDPRHPIVESICRETVKARKDRCVFATDWPHTRYDNLDVCQYLESILDMIEAENVPLDQVLVKNANVLLDGEP